MTALRFAVFGDSRLCASRCEAIRRHPNAELGPVFSVSDVETAGTRGGRDLIKPDEVDGVIVALPAHLAYSASLGLLESGLHVLTELPGARSVEDIVNLRAAERSSRAILKFGSTLRYHASVKKASQLASSGELGKLLTARAIYGHAGLPGIDARSEGILIGHGIHMLDLLHHFCGPFETVKAMSDADAPHDQNLFALLRTGANTIAQLHCSSTSWRQTFRLELGFEKGYLWLDGHLPGLPGYGPEVLVSAKAVSGEDGSKLPNPDETVETFEKALTAESEIAEMLDTMEGRRQIEHGTSHQAFDAMNIAQRICAATERWA
ncbi:Gfo/Idh/MocA family protein [Henriciella litoralis]|uniref:Gfo/Idh/MocA family protein n=1 Tax=Henriciella litoralis TaxID=568102 RepID=UPI000A049A8A|nr:Gfo/Idh/MocA family oxidoreductase [Henriciella litoralis]